MNNYNSEEKGFSYGSRLVTVCRKGLLKKFDLWSLEVFIISNFFRET